MDENKAKLEVILKSLHSSIAASDNKASITLTAVGIIFGISTFLLESVFKPTSLESIHIVLFIIGLLYLCAFVLCSCLLIKTFWPKHRNKIEKLNKVPFNQYYIDIFENRNNVDFLTKEPSYEAYLDQIKICSRIAKSKDRTLRIAIIFLFVMLASLFVSIILIAICLANPLVINS